MLSARAIISGGEVCVELTKRCFRDGSVPRGNREDVQCQEFQRPKVSISLRLAEWIGKNLPSVDQSAVTSKGGRRKLKDPLITKVSSEGIPAFCRHMVSFINEQVRTVVGDPLLNLDSAGGDQGCCGDDDIGSGQYPINLGRVR
jgi:hypothetical protein